MYKGIKQAIECPNSGAVANFHRIEFYTVDLRSKYSTLTVSGYVSAEAFANGKHAIISTNVTLQSVPGPSDFNQDYFYDQLVHVVPDVIADEALPHTPAPTNSFSGAELIPE